MKGTALQFFMLQIDNNLYSHYRNISDKIQNITGIPVSCYTILHVLLDPHPYVSKNHLPLEFQPNVAKKPRIAKYKRCRASTTIIPDPLFFNRRELAANDTFIFYLLFFIFYIHSFPLNPPLPAIFFSSLIFQDFSLQQLA